jgi:hypothetical protein
LFLSCPIHDEAIIGPKWKQIGKNESLLQAALFWSRQTFIRPRESKQNDGVNPEGLLFYE